MTDDFVRFTMESGDAVMVQVHDSEPGFRRASRADGAAVEATETFEAALRNVSRAAESALRVFRDGSLKPNAVEIEFGIRLNAEVGAVIAKTSVEGHLAVTLSWSPESGAREQSEDRSESGPGL
jgi:hypothetical protein